MGKKSRDKGARIEREMVHALQDEGFAAERVPLSGAMRGRFSWASSCWPCR
jgi:Holliday junction resolvase